MEAEWIGPFVLQRGQHQEQQECKGHDGSGSLLRIGGITSYLMISKQQIDTWRKPTARSSASRCTTLNDRASGIVHVIGPSWVGTQPGMTIVCGDSHTADCMARSGASAFGIGTSEVEHVLATQTLLQYKPKERWRYASTGHWRRA